MARARNGNAIQSKIQMTIYGEPFTGKSTMASQFAYMKNPDGSPFKVLYLDPESGSIDDYLGTMKANGVNPANIWIVYLQEAINTICDFLHISCLSDEVMACIAVNETENGAKVEIEFKNDVGSHGGKHAIRS